MLGLVNRHLPGDPVVVRPQLLEHRLHPLLNLRLREDQQPPLHRVDRRLHFGQDHLQLLEQLLGSGPIDRIDLQPGLVLRRPVRFHLVDRALDRRLLVGCGVRHDLIDLLVDAELGVGEQDR